MVCFPIRSHGGNQYIMLAYYCDRNTILVDTFKSKNNSYKSIMIRFHQRCHTVDPQVIDKEARQ